MASAKEPYSLRILVMNITVYCSIIFSHALIVMAGILSLSGRRHEPMPRMCHTSCLTGSKTLVHGGRTRDFSVNTRRRLACVVEMFDAYTEVWQQKEVTGEAPTPGVYGAASASVDDDLFTFGGYDGSRWCNSFHRLKRATQWIELCPQNDRAAESPMAKSGAGMVPFGNNLAIFGGYGIPHGPVQPGSSFIKDTRVTDGAGWTNELHIYNLNKNGMYSSTNDEYLGFSRRSSTLQFLKINVSLLTCAL